MKCKMNIYNIITVVIASLALAVSGYNFYYDRIYENEQLLVDFSGIKFEESNIDISVIFINNSKRYYAIKSITFEATGKGVDKNKGRGYTPLKNENNAFSLKPGEMTVKYIRTPTGLDEINGLAKDSSNMSFEFSAKIYFIDKKGKEWAKIIPLYELRVHEGNTSRQGILAGPLDIIKNADKTWDYSK